jgi:glycosyltransferase involved in cell wall biosynthesis
MLKDIFPQNAVDLGFIKKGIIFNYFRKKEKELYDVSDFIGCMSPANVAFVLKHNPEVLKEKVTICPNAIELKDRTNGFNKEEILKKINVPEGSFVFLYGGNLGVAQGIPFLIKLLDACKNRSDIFFIIAGSGNRSKLISEFIRRENPKNAVYYSMLPRTEYEFLELACDVGMVFLDGRFTIPNFPSRMLSYMEASLPLLITSDSNTDAGQIAENNGYGKWCEFGNLNKLLEQIDFFVKNPDLSKKMGSKGFEFLKANYSVEIAYNEIVNKIQNV